MIIHYMKLSVKMTGMAVTLLIAIGQKLYRTLPAPVNRALSHNSVLFL
jgi:hypothetical protein